MSDDLINIIKIIERSQNPVIELKNEGDDNSVRLKRDNNDAGER